MKFLGIPIDVLSIVAGAMFGTIFRGKLTVAYQRVVLIACGLVAAVVGFYGAYDNLIIFEKDNLELGGSVLVIFALVTGTILGGGFGISNLFAFIGKKISKTTAKKERDDSFRAKRLAEKNERLGKKNKGFDDLPTYELASTRFENRHIEGFVVASMMLSFGFLAVNAPYNAATGAVLTEFYIKAGIASPSSMSPCFTDSSFPLVARGERFVHPSMIPYFRASSFCL